MAKRAKGAGKKKKQGGQEAPIAVDGRFEHVVTLENMEEAKAIFPRSELSDLIAQAGERGRKNLLDDDGFYATDKVASYYLRKRSKDISAYIKQEDETARGIMGAAGIRDRRKRLREGISRNLTTLMMVHVQDMNVELARERLKAYSAKDADYSVIIDMVDNPDKYKLNTARGRKAARKALQSEEYQKLFDKLVPLFQRPAPKKAKKAGRRAPRRIIPAWAEEYTARIEVMAGDPAAYTKVETDGGVQELRNEFKDPKQQYFFDKEGLLILRAKAAEHRLEEARQAFRVGYASRAQALEYLDKAAGLGSGRAAAIKQTYAEAMQIIRESDGSRAENRRAESLLKSISDQFEVGTEIDLLHNLERAKYLENRAGKTRDPAERTSLNDNAKGLLRDALAIEAEFNGAKIYLERLEKPADGSS